MAAQQERFGDRLRHYREAAGYSQEALAERAGLSANAISTLERGGRKRPYPDTLRRLADALGLGDEARADLAAALRTHREAMSASAPAPDVPPRVIVDLPGEPTPLFGREREAEVVRHLLGHADGRLLTLTGPGGVGKTRLALHVARAEADRYSDGVVWVELAPLGDAALVLPTILHAIGLEPTPGGNVAEMLRARLRQRRVLLVLDNFEHVLPASAGIAALLLACPDLHALVTSRAPLNVRGEQEYVVPPLELPPAGAATQRDDNAAAAVQLFAWHARQKNPSFILTPENTLVVAAICRRLDGLPLALELVATRLRTLSPAELLARLDFQMPLLVGGSRDLPQRQQTMRAAIGWSYELLAPDAKALFRRLSVFAGGWTLEAAEAMVAGERADDVFDLLGLLVEQSLVTVSPDTTCTRYGMLEPVRQFALERLLEQHEDDDARRRHAGYFLGFATTAAGEIEGRSGQLAWLRRLDQEHDNLRAALDWSARDPDGAETGLRLASALWRFWEVRGHVAEGGALLAAALARSDGLPAELRARALTAAGNLARDRADYAQATTLHNQGLALWRQLGDKRGIAFSLNNLGVIARDQGDVDRTARLCSESLALCREVGDQHGAAIALISLGMAASQQGSLARARAHYEESLALFRASGDRWHIAWVLTYLAQLLVRMGDLAGARSAGTESLQLHRDANDAWGIASALGVRGRIAQAGGEFGTAVAWFTEGFHQLLEAGVERAIPACLDDLACLALARGDPDRAARLGGVAASLREATGVPQTGYEGSPLLADLERLRVGAHEVTWLQGRAMSREELIAEVADFAQEITNAAVD